MWKSLTLPWSNNCMSLLPTCFLLSFVNCVNMITLFISFEYFETVSDKDFCCLQVQLYLRAHRLLKYTDGRLSFIAKILHGSLTLIKAPGRTSKVSFFSYFFLLLSGKSEISCAKGFYPCGRIQAEIELDPYQGQKSKKALALQP